MAGISGPSLYPSGTPDHPALLSSARPSGYLAEVPCGYRAPERHQAALLLLDSLRLKEDASCAAVVGTSPKGEIPSGMTAQVTVSARPRSCPSPARPLSVPRRAEA